MASFGAVRALRKGEVGTSTRLGYSFIVRETGGRTLEITPRQGITQEYFRVRNDLVQCDVDTVQYSLFNFGVNKFISGVNSYNLGVIVQPGCEPSWGWCEEWARSG